MDTLIVTTTLILSTLLLFQVIPVNSKFTLTVLHTNDIHARYEEISGSGGVCKTKHKLPGGKGCFGGVARMKTEVDRRRNTDENVVLLNAGDNFQGTTWYSILGWHPTAYFMNLLEYDAMGLGNHEFDRGIDGIAMFINNVTFPVLSSNLDVSNEVRLKNVNKSTIITIENRLVGVIGYTTEETVNISAAGDTVTFNDVVSSVRIEAKRLNEKGINIIVALGHAGYKVDKIIAEIPEVDIVVGGHSNTFLYDGKPPSSPDKEGGYPFVVNRNTSNGRSHALVVQDYAYGKYLGRLKVNFDEAGNIVSWSGNPILLNNNVTEDPGTKVIVDDFKKNLKESEDLTVAQTDVHLDGDKSCRYQECKLGDLIADAYVDNFNKKSDGSWPNVALAIINGGGIKASIEIGNITYTEIKMAQPYSDDIVVVELSGKTIRTVFDHATKKLNISETSHHGKFLQVSGFRLVYKIREGEVTGIEEIKVTCTECPTRKLENMKDNKMYKVVMSKFLAGGGDGYHMIRDKGRIVISADFKDDELLMNYLKKLRVVKHCEYPKDGGRISFRDTSEEGNTGPSLLDKFRMLLDNIITCLGKLF